MEPGVTVDPYLRELLKISLKLDGVQRTQETQATIVLELKSDMSQVKQDIANLQGRTNRVDEAARAAQQSSSDLERRREDFELNVKRSVDALATGIGSRVERLEKETTSQTPIIHKIREAQERRDAEEAAAARFKAEAEERARVEVATAEKVAREAKAEREEVARIQRVELERRRSNLIKVIAAITPVAAIAAGIITAYLFGRQPAIPPAIAPPPAMTATATAPR